MLDAALVIAFVTIWLTTVWTYERRLTAAELQLLELTEPSFDTAATQALKLASNDGNVVPFSQAEVDRFN